MALLNILQFPDQRLKKTAELVDTFDHDIFRLVDDMLETMYEASGVGLAAIQVNVPKQVIVIDVSEERNKPLCLINPEIISSEGTVDWEEGCLSFPGVFAKIKRAKEIEVSYYDRLGIIRNIKADGLLSVCIQHEMEHLKGITFFDHLSPLKQSMMRKKLEKIHRRAL